MNSQTQYLQKQNQRLQNQVHFLLDVLDRMGLEHDFLGSIACGFAWDMAAEEDIALAVWTLSEREAEAFLKLDEMTK